MCQISSSLWYRLSVLLNFLPTESDLAKIGQFFDSYCTVPCDWCLLKAFPLLNIYIVCHVLWHTGTGVRELV